MKVSTLEQIKREYKSKRKSIEDGYSKQVKELTVKAEKDDALKAKEEKMTHLDSDYEQTKKELKDLKPLLILTEQDYQSLSMKFGHLFEAGIGAEAVRKLLSKINLENIQGKQKSPKREILISGGSCICRR